MTAPFEHDAVLSSLVSECHWDAVLDLDNELHTVRFLRSTFSDSCLSQLQAPPAYDVDLNASVDKLRNYLKKALGVTPGPPVLLTQVLSACFGYRGSPIRSTAEGLRVLLQVPELDSIDLTTLFTRLPQDTPAAASTAPTPDSARLDRLESALAQMQAAMLKTIGDAVQQAMASRSTPTKPAKTKPSKSAATAPEHVDVDMSEPPAWEFKSGSQVLEVLGSVYTQLLSMGATNLAAELYSVRAEVDYAFMLPTEASDDEPPENVYVAKHSGLRWKRDCPAPGRCYECKGAHWRENCPVAAKKTEQNSARSLQRGSDPPGRFYISKGGQIFDTTRRPLQECKRCSGKFHWFWNCPKGPSTVYIPRGASFTDKVDSKAVNASGARFSKSHEATTDGEGSTYSSASVAEILPVKRPRKVNHRSRENPSPAGAPPVAQQQPPAYPPQYPQPWGWYPPAPWGMPPWAASPPGYPPTPQPAHDPQRFSQPQPQQPQPQQQQQVQTHAPMPPVYQQWGNAMQPPPPPPPAMVSHQPYAQPGDSSGAHAASY